MTERKRIGTEPGIVSDDQNAKVELVESASPRVGISRGEYLRINARNLLVRVLFGGPAGIMSVVEEINDIGAAARYSSPSRDLDIQVTRKS